VLKKVPMQCPTQGELPAAYVRLTAADEQTINSKMLKYKIVLFTSIYKCFYLEPGMAHASTDWDHTTLTNELSKTYKTA
jgi:hypothetical protein